MNPINVAFAPDDKGEIVAHRIDCPDVRQQADLGIPVLTCLDIQKALSPDTKRHSCLEGS